VRAAPPVRRTGKSVGVVGSGPAGLAAAQQLNRAGHHVTVYEKDDRLGGLIRYGIPEYKMDTAILERRLRQLEEEGIEFRPNCHAGVDLPAEELRDSHDALVLAVGAMKARDLDIPGRELGGIHMAMDYLTLQNRRCEGDEIPDEEFISAADKHVVIIGGGDTGADCLGTAHRQGAKSVVQLWLYPEPPKARMSDNPWPLWPNIFRISPAHEEGGKWEYSVATTAFRGTPDGRVQALQGVRVKVERQADGSRVVTEVPGSEFEIPADLVLLAIGFAGPQPEGLISDLGLELTSRGSLKIDSRRMTSSPGVFAAGDATLGASIIVWAIAEGRQVARSVDEYLMGESLLP
ncbi:MAG: glutamate synthase subunit beta, partial [Chloroflexota bacterium]|nr:glutamate synthase subunit beta [Chloroflexota bacterium]